MGSLNDWSKMNLPRIGADGRPRGESPTPPRRQAEGSVDDALDRLDTSLNTLDYYCSHPTGTTAADCRVCIVTGEGKEALATVRQRLAEQDTEIQRLRESAWPVELHQQYLSALDERDSAIERAEAAEAEVQRLTEGLREIAAMGLPDQTLVVKASALLSASPDGADEWFIPEGDRLCGVVHRNARATCMKRRGHDGPHATPQGTWIDGPWCEYPDGANTEGGEA